MNAYRVGCSSLLVLLACVSWPIAAYGQDAFESAKLDNWHQWRGPLATGVAPHGNPPLEWDQGKNLRWKVEIPGRGSATPIVWGDRVFVLTAVETDRDVPAPAKPAEETPAANPDAPASDSTAAKPAAERPPRAEQEQPSEAAPTNPQAAQGEQPNRAPGDRPEGEGGRRRGGRGGRGGFGSAGPPKKYHRFEVLCLDRATGKVLWQRTAREAAPHEGHQQTNSFASGSPTTDGRFLYASFSSHGIYCYDMEGNLIWEQDLGDMQTRNGFGEGASPTLTGNVLVVPWDNESGSFVAALDARTGETLWRADRDEQTQWSTPLVVEHGGRKQAILNATNRVRSYDVATGELLWECGGQTSNAIPSPVSADGVVYCVSGHRGRAAYAIPLDAQGDISDTDRILWHHDRGTPYVPSPLLADGMLFYTQHTQGILTIVDAKSGDVVLEMTRLPNISNIYASPVAAAGRVYIVGRDGTTLVTRQGKELEVLATNKLDDPIDASPAIAGKQIFLRSAGHLYCFEEP